MTKELCARFFPGSLPIVPQDRTGQLEKGTNGEGGGHVKRGARGACFRRPKSAVSCIQPTLNLGKYIEFSRI